jgi:hypothetical protein
MSRPSRSTPSRISQVGAIAPHSPLSPYERDGLQPLHSQTSGGGMPSSTATRQRVAPVTGDGIRRVPGERARGLDAATGTGPATHRAHPLHTEPCFARRSARARRAAYDSSMPRECPGAHRRSPGEGISGARHEVRSESGYPQQTRGRLVTFPSFFIVPNRGEAIVRNLDAKQPADVFGRERRKPAWLRH